MVYEWIPSPNFRPGRAAKIQYIVLHHWDDPAKKPTIEGVLNHFQDPSVQVSAHYVVSGDRIVQMVKETDTAWHAIQANPFTIGIEVDPQVPGNTYSTVGRLVSEIRQRNGDLPLRKHSDFNQTDCPGDLDLGKIDNIAQEGDDMRMTIGVMDSLKFLATRQKVTQPEIDKYQSDLEGYVQYLTQVQAEHNVAPLVVDQTAQAQLERVKKALEV